MPTRKVYITHSDKRSRLILRIYKIVGMDNSDNMLELSGPHISWCSIPVGWGGVRWGYVSV
jgi:hypothetical protein